MSKRKVFISQPMSGLTEREILEARHKAIKAIQETYDDVEIIDSYFSPDIRNLLETSFDDIKNWSLYYLGTAIQKLSQADTLWLVGDWQHSNGCNIEFDCANRYGLDIVYN